MSEVRALLLTDVVDSTQLAERLGDTAAAELSAAHDRVARDLLRAWRGREIDKTDGMLMLFDAASDALGFATAYHGALAGLPVPLKARAGLHVGPVILRANPPDDVAHGAKPLEVEGIAKPVAARVMSLALGGQTLLTAEARAALGATALRLQSHGFWRIKGIAEPVELFEAGDERAPFMPPPDSAKVYRVVRRDELWLPLREVAHGLPAERDAFIGRQDALAELARRFHMGARLVSVLGVGGTGKTRLATRFGWTWLGDFPGGAWFCDLSSARDPDGIVQAVAKALGVPLGADDPVQQLGHAIAGRGNCLVILDNFEQVARHAGNTLGRWLDRAADARFLVTTREVLGLPGEEALALPPLAAAEAAALFRQRAASAKFDFIAGPDDQAAILRLVKLLDGLPLAIELAAARVRVMSPGTLLSRMDERFKLLAAMGGRQDRQATLRATFDWSWELLNESEKSALAQLSVFEGGFTLEAAEAVLDLSACTTAAWTVDVVHSLVDKSFVRSLDGDRFDLLVSVQQYAAEQLESSGCFPGSGQQARISAEVAHSAYFAALDATKATASGCIEIGNLVTACRRAVLRDIEAVAVAALENAWAALDLRGPFAVGVELAHAVLAATTAAQYRARAALVAGMAAGASGMRELARKHFESALAIAHDVRDVRTLGQAHCHLGALLILEGLPDEAMVHRHDGLTAAREADDPALLCTALNGLAADLARHGVLEEARACYEQALQVARTAHLLRWEGALLGNLGSLDADIGCPMQARANYEAALDAAKRAGDLKFAGNTLSNLGLLEHLDGRHADAKMHFEEALAIAQGMGHRRLEAIVLCNLGIHFDGQGHPVDAKDQFERAVTIARELQDLRSEGQFLGHLGMLHARSRDFVAARRCLNDGHALLQRVGDPISLAILLCAWAESEQMAGEPNIATYHLAQAAKLAGEAGAGADSELGIALTRAKSCVSSSDTATSPTTH